VLVVVALLAGMSGGSGPADSARSSQARKQTARADQASSHARRVADDPMALGDVHAPVVMVMWSDFQCPFCGHFARETEPKLIQRYVNKGVLRIEWRDFPYIGPESLPAAVAGRAAAAQGRFWEFGEVVYGQERRPRSSAYDATHLRTYARQAGLDMSRFDADVAEQKGMAAVQADLAEATELGVTGTPAFLVNGSPIIGAQPLESFVSVIEQAASEAGQPVS
jgi:protein-disulfide isomerase